MALTDDVTFPLDGSGKATTGAQSDATDYAFPVKGDEDARTMHVSLYRWDSAGLEWVKWDGKMDTVVSGDLIVAVDDLEDLVTAGNAILTNIQTAVEAVQGNANPLGQYSLANYDASGDPIYVGYLDVDGNYYIKRITTSTGVVDYSSGSSGYSTAWTNRASESYQSFDAEF